MITSSLLATVPEIIHGFGTRKDEPLLPGLVMARQVHGSSLFFVVEETREQEIEADILMTEQDGIPLAIETADCLPILMVEPKSRLIAAVHAGWKGTLQRIVPKALEQIVQRGGWIEELHVAMGPAIAGACYEVSEDVALPFQKEFKEADCFLKTKNRSKWLLDLAEANRLELVNQGVPPERIDRIDLCTHCREDLFHSYRRERKGTGRLLNVIQLVSP